MDIIQMFEHAEEFKFLLHLATLLVAAGIGGWLSKKISMPSVLGQILVGIIIGPTVLNIVNGGDEFIHIVSQIGVIFLMFLAGLETNLKELKSLGKGVSLIVIGNTSLPFIFGSIIPLFFFKQYLPTGNTDSQLLYALFIGTILTATSVSISVSVLRDMKQLASKQGTTILGVAIIDDVLGIILLAVISGLISPDSTMNIGQVTMNIVVFFVVVVLASFIIAKGITRFAQGNVWRDRIITYAIVICFAFSFMAELFNVAAITGAYFAGVSFAATPYRHRVINKIQSLAYILFTPIFFVSIGLSIVISSDIIRYIGYALTIVAIAIITKIVGCSIGAKISGYSNKQSLQIGIGMIARAEVALIVSNQGLKSGIITNETFTSIVLLVVISTILSPPLLKYLFRGEKPVTTYIEDEE